MNSVTTINIAKEIANFVLDIAEDDSLSCSDAVTCAALSLRIVQDALFPDEAFKSGVATSIGYATYDALTIDLGAEQ